MSGMEELRKLAEESDEPAQEEPVVELAVVPDGEPTLEDGEGETPTLEDEEHLELELEGEAATKPKYTTEETLLHKLTKRGKQLKGAKSELEQLKEENERLKAGNLQPAPVVQTQPVIEPTAPVFPDLYDPNINGDKAKYSQAVHQYMHDFNNAGVQTAAATQQQTKLAADEEARAGRLAQRSATFITEQKEQGRKLSDELAIEAIQAGTQALDDASGMSGAGLFMLDSVGDGSEKVAYYLGRNPSAVATVQKLLKEDPNGFKAIAWLTKTAEKLKPKGKHISKAPAPDEALEGNGQSVSAGAWQKKYDDAKDVSTMVKIMKDARLAGITVK